MNHFLVSRVFKYVKDFVARPVHYTRSKSLVFIVKADDYLGECAIAHCTGYATTHVHSGD